ncbi:hypothetical protein Ae201684P_018150 [Aphanomyces euteiches]|uniref:Uncharacterized protein n=1 Tax=Aphanomyces euteiches TaxID=100861 RepID=A0A6G0X3I4_9STRA|nr:hypothetical protein Ae201684_008919 [Aphanomyces euteiches]KAH9054430.1 hypothetical protein Ae201684P_018150 [Aphanomyces euteiches]
MDDVLSFLSDRTAGIEDGCLGFPMFQDETVWSFNGMPEVCGFEESCLTESSVFDSDELTALVLSAVCSTDNYSQDGISCMETLFVSPLSSIWLLLGLHTTLKLGAFVQTNGFQPSYRSRELIAKRGHRH